MMTVKQIKKQLSISHGNAKRIHDLLLDAFEQGTKRAWENQDGRVDPDFIFKRGMEIDRIAEAAHIGSHIILMLFEAAYDEGRAVSDDEETKRGVLQN